MGVIALIIIILRAYQLERYLPSPYPMASAPIPTFERRDYSHDAAIPTNPDVELLGQARLGNQAAFLALVMPSEKSVYRNALRLTGNKTDAEDVLQETMIKAYTRLGQFSGNSSGVAGSLGAWLSRIAANESIDTIRRRQARRVISLDDPVPGGDGSDFVPRATVVTDDPEQQYTRLEMRRILADVIEHLDPSFRRVCLLRDVAQFTTEETAEILGISSAAVRIRLFRARLKLRDRLQQIFARPACEISACQSNSSPPYVAHCGHYMACGD